MKYKKPCSAIIVTKNGKILYEKYINCDMFTQFRVASLTKPFTAMAIMMLAQDNKLKLDDSLSKYLNLPKWSKQISIRNLLNHTSGVPDYEQVLYKTFKSPPKMQDALDVIRSQQILLFKPGEKQQYSESGYVLLALVVQKLTGSYASFLKERIFDTLKMRDTTLFDETNQKIRNRAYGYKKDYDLLNLIVGNEGIYSSARDLSKWSQVWYSKKLVNKDLLDQSLSSKFERGFSWKLNSIANKLIIYHGGSWVGFRSIMAIVPSQKLSIIFLSNNTEFDTESQRLFIIFNLLCKYI